MIPKTVDPMQDGRTAAVAAATSALHLVHLEAARGALSELRDRGATFSADDIHAAVPADTDRFLAERPGLLGGLVSEQVRGNKLMCMGWATSRRRPGHPVRVWIGSAA